MLRYRQKKAVRLLFQLPDDQVAEKLGVRPTTLRRWKAKKDFIDAMKSAARDVQDSASRIVSSGIAQAASKLQLTLLAEQETLSRNDLKALVDMLKASGILATAARNADEDIDLMAEFLDDDEDETGV